MRGGIVYDIGARTNVSESNMCVKPWPRDVCSSKQNIGQGFLRVEETAMIRWIDVVFLAVALSPFILLSVAGVIMMIKMTED